MIEIDNQKKEEVIEILASIPKEMGIPYDTSKKLKYIRNFLIHDDGANLNERDIHILESIVDFYKQWKDHPDKTILKNILLGAINSFEGNRSIRIADSEYNTEEYYKKTIEELMGKIANLNNKINEANQSKEQQKELKEELENTKEQIRQIKADKEELEKKLDAQKNIKNKITNAFEELKIHISHLENEKKRLKWMFYVYAVLCVCVLLLLVYFEYKYLSKWENHTALIDYLPFYIPVPIVGGLLWVFICQMNRAQRQLMLVAYELYNVDYVEGLLQAINMVSPNVASATEKIGNVLDVLIKKHIKTPNESFENSLEKEISKDNIDLKTFINLAKEVKDVVK